MKLDATDLHDLAPVIRAIVAETLEQIDGDRGRLGYTEQQAAETLGIAPHVLRDCRRRGEITARLAGKKYIYSKAALLKFLSSS